MSKRHCDACGEDREPFGDFGPGGVVVCCGNVECRKPLDKQSSPSVQPARRAQETTAAALGEPQSLDDMTNRLRARRVFLTAEIEKLRKYETEAEKIDVLLGLLEDA